MQWLLEGSDEAPDLPGLGLMSAAAIGWPPIRNPPFAIRNP